MKSASLLSIAAFVVTALVAIPNNVYAVRKSRTGKSCVYETQVVWSVHSALDPRTGKRCVDDTQIIWDAESRVTDDSKSRVYHLCSDTVFPIGVLNVETLLYENGMPAIEVFRANLHIVCGDDGNRDNNCTLNGGGWHLELGAAAVLSNDNTELTPDVINVVVSGVTFTNVRDGNVYLLSDPSITSNHITFDDCLFANNNASVIIEASQPNSNVNVYNCSFLNNTLKAGGIYSANTAILRSEYAPRFNIINCVFQNNDLTTTEFTYFSAVIYGIGVDIPGTEVNIFNSCFVDNTGYSFATVVIEKNPSFVSYINDNNYEYDTSAMGDFYYECNGIGRVLTTGLNGTALTAECLSEFMSATCALDVIAVTTVSPSPAFVTAQTPTIMTIKPPIP